MGRVYVHLDGPRNSIDQDIQLKILNLLNDNLLFQSMKISIKTNNSNLGLRNSVINGIDWFFENEEQGIILEDDLTLEPFALQYFQNALDSKKCRQNYVSVSGNQFLATDRYGYINYPLIWGWATWREKWNLIKIHIEEPQSLHHLDIKNLPFSGFISGGLIRISNGKLDSWAFTFLAASVKYNWCHLVPPSQLISNIGDDEFATHTENLPNFAIASMSRNEELPEIPNQITRDHNLEKFVLRNLYNLRLKHLFSPLKAFLETNVIKMGFTRLG